MTAYWTPSPVSENNHPHPPTERMEKPMRIIINVVASAVLALCSLTCLGIAQSPAPVTQPVHGEVYILRPKAKLSGRLANPRIVCDSELVSVLNNGHYLKLELAPGKHLISTGTGASLVDVQPDGVYWYRIVFHDNFLTVSEPTFEIRSLSEDEAQRLMKKAQPQSLDKKY